MDPNSNALISRLEDEVAFLRDQLRRQQEIIAQQAMTMRQLTAAPVEEASKVAETVEETSDRAESHSATRGTQEGADLPQQRSVPLAPVDKLPWWHYVLGLFLVSLTTFVSFLVPVLVFLATNSNAVAFIVAIVANVVLVWLPSAAFGLWVGLRRMNPHFWSRAIPFGLLVGLAASLGRVGQLFAVGTHFFGGGSDMYYWSGFIVGPALPGWLFYVSGVLVGNAWQRRRTRQLSGFIPASPEPSTSWTPRQQAILGFAGTVIAAVISLMGAIGSALVASGG